MVKYWVPRGFISNVKVKEDDIAVVILEKGLLTPLQKKWLINTVERGFYDVKNNVTSHFDEEYGALTIKQSRDKEFMQKWYEKHEKILTNMYVDMENKLKQLMEDE